MSDRMAEAEVSLRLAFWLAISRRATGEIRVAIDGAQVRTKDTVHFDLPLFMRESGWAKGSATAAWQGVYRRPDVEASIAIHSSSGEGDVVARLTSGCSLRAECKKGPLGARKSSPEYPLLREALGQLLTVPEAGEGDILAVAVPESQKFVALAERWRNAPLVKRLGIRILTIDQGGRVNGLDD